VVVCGQGGDFEVAVQREPVAAGLPASRRWMATAEVCERRNPVMPGRVGPTATRTSRWAWLMASYTLLSDQGLRRHRPNDR
jgi:hypothetical protein